MKPKCAWRILVLSASCLACFGPVFGMDHVTLRRDGELIRVEGRALVTAQDGGVLIEGRDGVLWTVPPDELVERTSDDAPFTPLSPKELAGQLLGELPRGFSAHHTANYVICYRTSRAYAQWCGALFERLHRAFTNYWSNKGFELSDPEFPLVAIVFADQQAYIDFAREEVGPGVKSVIGYFSLRTNRMTMYDLTGIERARDPRVRVSTTDQINWLLAQPAARRTVATIVHEATHQIAFNCGLHTRYSDCPLWFSEGIAVYFETPDLESSKGWSGIGMVNRPRLVQFREYLKQRPADSLVTLIADDQRFRDPKRASDAYAETWALTYFLIHQHPREYVDYLRLLSQKEPLTWDTPEARLEKFKQAFGEDFVKLDAQFVRYVVRGR